MDDQCGLCLSCGVPFMPDLSRVEYFNRNGVLSIVFLQSEFVNNAEIRRMYSTPKFSSGVERAHMFHVSHHSTALDYMCNRHRDDEDVGLGFMLAGNVFPPAGTVITAAPSQPFLYYRSPASHNHKEPFGAVWTKPARAERLNMRRLLRHLRNSTQFNSCAPIGHNLDETYDACTGCNALMTQLADFRYILGYRNVATLNGNGCIITNQAITQFSVDTHNTTLNNAYGSWTYRNNPAVTQHPARDARDADAPHVAYYLHLCLPYQAPGRANYFNQIQSAPLRLECRKIYLEQCWLVLEIACLATLLEEGKVTAPGTSLSHGLHQHYGVLDIYVSFFIYRLISFRYGRRLRARGVNFVQWHQKFYCDAMNCSFLFSRAENHGIIGQKVYSTTAQNAVDLVQQISDRLVRGTENRLRPLIKHVVGILDVPHEITEYFVPVATLRQLVARSRQVVSTDFQSALGKFGINALLHRIIRLCKDYPAEFTNQLMDFRSNWQMVEIDRVRKNARYISFGEAYHIYQLCQIMDAPAEQPISKEVADEVFAEAEYCSYWNSVLAIDAVGALQDRPV